MKSVSRHPCWVACAVGVYISCRVSLLLAVAKYSELVSVVFCCVFKSFLPLDTIEYRILDKSIMQQSEQYELLGSFVLGWVFAWGSFYRTSAWALIASLIAIISAEQTTSWWTNSGKQGSDVHGEGLNSHPPFIVVSVYFVST